jgi:hypothetical protein
MTRRRARKISAFWEGGSGGADGRNTLTAKRKSASAKRMGRMVNV